MSPDTRRLEAGFLYAVLTYRGDLAAWHWSFFVPDPSASPIGTRGMFFHIDDYETSTEWNFERECRDIVGSPLTVAIIRLTAVDYLGNYADVVGDSGLLPMFKTVSMPGSALSHELLSCRTWFLEAVKVLNDCGVVSCEDAGLLEKEIRRYGFTAMGEYLQDKGWTAFHAEHCS